MAVGWRCFELSIGFLEFGLKFWPHLQKTGDFLLNLLATLHGILKGKYHCTDDLLIDWFGLVVLQIKTKIVSCQTANSEPVKQEVNGTVIIPPSVFPGSRL